MRKRRLGRSSIEVAPLCFGGNVFGWTVDERQSFALLDAFVDAGFNFIDTADVYSVWVSGNQGGESEAIIGKWQKARRNRDRLVIATKLGMAMGPQRKGLSRAYMRSAVEASLSRLRTDYIDLYQAHEDDAQTPMEETLAAFAELVKEGKVRVIGASNFTAPRLAQALSLSEKLGLPRYESLQPLYNLADRAGFEKELEPLCLKESVGVIPYYALGAGFLTGKYRSQADLGQSPRGARVKDYLNDRGRRILKALDDVSARVGARPAQVALAWLIARPSITAPIASATTPVQLEDLLAGARLKLDREAVELLNAASA